MNIKSFPKIELHCHLEGAIRLKTIHELSNTLADKLSIPIMNITACREYYCVTSPLKDLTSFIAKFSYTQALLDTVEIIERIAFEVVEDAFLNRIVLVELRYSPMYIISSIRSDHSHLSLESVHDAVRKGISRARIQYDIEVGLIAIFDRTRNEIDTLVLSDFISKHSKEFVGVDIASDEKYSSVPFINVFKIAKNNGLGITAHAGEAGVASNVNDAIELLGATRIGHGINVIYDVDVICLSKSKNILFEVSPISNVRTAAVLDYESHPIRKMMDAGLKVCINTDDPGIFDSSIIDEYEMLVRYHNFTESDFLTANLCALDGSFFSQEIKNIVRMKHFDSLLIPK